MPSTLPQPKLLIALTSLCAEGTPVLVLELCRLWLAQGLQPTVVLFWPQPADLAPEFAALGVPLVYLQLPKNGLGRYLALIRQMYRICRRLRPAAVLSMPLGWHTCVAYGAKLAGVPRVAAHVGNYPPHWAGVAFYKFWLQVQLGRPVTHRLICCSDYIRQGVIRYFKVRPSETVTVYNGFPDHRLALPSPKAPLPRPNQPFTIGMVARLEQHKDQPTLIRAARLLKDQGLNIQVQLIGEGSRRPEYEALIQALDLQDTVHLLGMRRDIPTLLQQMDVFAFSAKPDEGFGVALAEAMAAGVPVVATDVGACREVLDQGWLGWLVPPQNPEAMATALAEVMHHPQKSQHKATQAQIRALEKFTLGQMAAGYRQVLCGRLKSLPLGKGSPDTGKS